MNYSLTRDPLDALSFYVYDAGCILANDIARRPFGKTDRGQTLPFHEFMQCHKLPRYVPCKCTYVPYDGTFGASDQGQTLDV